MSGFDLGLPICQFVTMKLASSRFLLVSIDCPFG